MGQDIVERLRELANEWPEQHEFGEAAGEIERLRSDIERLIACSRRILADARRYEWLRMRLRVFEQRALSGSYKDAISIRIGQSFFDSKTRGDAGYVDASKFWKECDALDAAIDAALAAKERT